jgi:ATP-dependent RNA helicase DeaD
VNKKTGREQGMVRFSIALGRSSGVRAADVVASVARNANVPGSALGAIKIGQSRTTVDVAEKYAMQVAKKLRKGFVLRGQTVTMNPE